MAFLVDASDVIAKGPGPARRIECAVGTHHRHENPFLNPAGIKLRRRRPSESRRCPGRCKAFPLIPSSAVFPAGLPMSFPNRCCQCLLSRQAAPKPLHPRRKSPAEGPSPASDSSLASRPIRFCAIWKNSSVGLLCLIVPPAVHSGLHQRDMVAPPPVACSLGQIKAQIGAKCGLLTNPALTLGDSSRLPPVTRGLRMPTKCSPICFILAILPGGNVFGLKSQSFTNQS